MALGDVHRLSDRDVEKYYKRYKMVSGKNVAEGLIDPPLHLLARLVNWCLSSYGGIDEPDALVKDWKNNQLIKQWLSEYSGSIVVHGGAIATLLIIAITALKHFRLREPASPYQPRFMIWLIRMNLLELTLFGEKIENWKWKLLRLQRHTRKRSKTCHNPQMLLQLHH